MNYLFLFLLNIPLIFAYNHNLFESTTEPIKYNDVYVELKNNIVISENKFLTQKKINIEIIINNYNNKEQNLSIEFFIPPNKRNNIINDYNIIFEPTIISDFLVKPIRYFEQNNIVHFLFPNFYKVSHYNLTVEYIPENKPINPPYIFYYILILCITFILCF